jgi:hypothetical protein
LVIIFIIIYILYFNFIKLINLLKLYLFFIGRFGESGEYSNLSKYFVVGDTESGEILLNVTIDENAPMKLSMIIPGANDDVFIGTPHGLVRIHV